MITIPTYMATELVQLRIQQLHADAEAARRSTEARAARRGRSTVNTSQATRRGWLRRRTVLEG